MAWGFMDNDQSPVRNLRHKVFSLLLRSLHYNQLSAAFEEGCKEQAVRISLTHYHTVLQGALVLSFTNLVESKALETNYIPSS